MPQKKLGDVRSAAKQVARILATQRDAILLTVAKRNLHSGGGEAKTGSTVSTGNPQGNAPLKPD